jgi:WD40 repeat protein
MKCLTNENIIRLIFESLTLFKSSRQFSNMSKNKTLTQILLKTITYKNIYKSMGRSKTVIKAHNDLIRFLALLPNNNILTVSDKKKIKVWDIDTKKCIKTIEENHAILSTLLSDGNIIYSTDLAIKVISPQINYKEIMTKSIERNYHFYENLFLLPNGNISVTAWHKGFTKLFILGKSNYNQIKAIDFYGSVNNFIDLDGNRFACATNKSTISIWDINEDYKECACLAGNQGLVTSLIFNINFDLLISSHKDETIKAWNTSNYQCVRTIIGHNEVISLLLLPGGYFVAGDIDGKIKLFDIVDFTRMKTLKCKNPMPCLSMLRAGRMISASDNEIIIFDY